MMAKFDKLAATSAGTHGHGQASVERLMVPKPEAHAGNAPMPWHCHLFADELLLQLYGCLLLPTKPLEEAQVLHHGEGGCPTTPATGAPPNLHRGMLVDTV